MFDLLKPYKEHLVGEIGTIGPWAVLHVEPTMAWPFKVQKVRFRDRDFYLLPISTDHGAAIAVRLAPGENYKSPRKEMLSFLSAVVWTQRGGAQPTGFTGTSRYPVPSIRSNRNVTITEALELTYLPEPDDEKARLALALYREGCSVNHPAFAFLNFFRVLEVKTRAKDKIIKWLNYHADFLVDHRAKEIASRLKAQHGDLGTYFYESGRCAIAHANSGTIVDPDDDDDFERLNAELPLIRALAERCVELKLGVKTQHTIWKEHLYELDGFKKALGEEFLTALAVPDFDWSAIKDISLPIIKIGMTDRPPYPHLARMVPTTVRFIEGVLWIDYFAEEHGIMIWLGLDFAEERLRFELEGIRHSDEETAEMAEAVAELIRFQMHYLMNGRLEIHDAETGERVARKDAYMPVNVIIEPDAFQKLIDDWKAKAVKLREAGKVRAALSKEEDWPKWGSKSGWGR